MYMWMMLKTIGCFNPLPCAPTTSQVDKNEYQLGMLDNEMIVLLARDPSLVKASFCLGVEAGSRDDPVAIEGVAHLTEHLMKYSSKLDNVVNGGLLAEELFLPSTDHMFTTGHHYTIYTLHTTNGGIGRVADIVAMVMAAPHFAPADIALEAKAIDTELGLWTHCPSFINTDILADIHITGGCILRNGCGNMRTFGQPETVESVRHFWEKNYYGQKMSLVIFSSLPFEEMRALADKFECIRSNPGIKRTSGRTREYDKEEARSLLASFRPIEDLKLQQDALQWIYRAKATGHVSLVCINILLPSFLKYYRILPLGIIGHFIKNHVLIAARPRLNDLGCAIPECSVMFYNSVDYAKLTIELVLTARGVLHYKEILDTVLEALRNADLSKEFFTRWVDERKGLFDTATNEYTHDLIKMLSIEALFGHPSDILSGSYLYRIEEIDRQLIRKLLSYMKDFNNWIVIIMDRNYRPGGRHPSRNTENTYYEREKKPGYSPDSQCYAYAQPRGEDTLKAGKHSCLRCINHYAPGVIKGTYSSWSKVKRKSKTCMIEFEGNPDYACLYLLLLELARIRVQTAQSAEDRSIADKVLITLYTSTNAAECKFIAYFSTDGTKDALCKTIEQYIETARNPEISDSFEVAKAHALYRYSPETTFRMMLDREEFFATERRIDRQAQADAIASLRNEEIIEMSILESIQPSSIKSTVEDDCTMTLALSPIFLPSYLIRCRLLACVGENKDLCIYNPLSDTVVYSHFQYLIRHTYTLLCGIPGTRLNLEDAEEPLCYMYDVFMCELILRLLKPTFIIDVARTQLHAYCPKVHRRCAPTHNLVGLCFSVPSKLPFKDHLETIDAFVASGSNVIGKIPPDSFNRAFEAMMDEVSCEEFVERFACVTNGQTQLDVEVPVQKHRLRKVMTQENVVSIYGQALTHGRMLCIPSRPSKTHA